MQYQLSDVQHSDAEVLVRKCEIPANRRDPLRTIMFPNANARLSEEDEEIVKWTVESLQESLENNVCYFRKVMLGLDFYVGYAVWSLEYGSQGMKKAPAPDMRCESWNPATLDTRAWAEVSDRLREERKRVLHGQQTIWRLTSIQVAPEHQRKGIGSMLMQWGCDKADLNRWNSFVMASPAGVPLYHKFGFKETGQVWTELGIFKSMFRESKKAV
ncbi:hypothetical protein WAI453_001082 [Rhynchosporium graminicola]|uniref:N-acetyltransferase domain-containing protein n=1 Tax=Rhynchosporium graminicola TaxID=2792576 RepID=A0A1E1K6N2_9HELO|nr:uncharacterized protein RCO7_09542 [Rhynchosporium commune]